MAGNLDGKTALGTGGGSGIGRSTSLAYAREGARIVVADMNVEGGEETVQMIKEAGGEAVLVHADVSDAAGAQLMVERALEALAAWTVPSTRRHIRWRRAPPLGGLRGRGNFDRVIRINLKGVWLSMKPRFPRC